MYLLPLLSSLLALVCLMNRADAYGNGSVMEACHTMMPEHSPHTPQTAKCPFTVYATKSTYTPGGNLTVTLEADGSGAAFEGFLLQARQVGQHVPIGRFIVVDSRAQGLTCNNMKSASVSHVTSQKITKLQTTWLAPPDENLGNIMFCATFVAHYNEFWVNVNSPVISRSSSTSSSHQLNFRESLLFAMVGITVFLDFIN